MGSFSIWHWLVVLVIVMLIFGTKKLRNVGADLGGAVRGFKDGMRESGDKSGKSDTAPQVWRKTYMSVLSFTILYNSFSRGRMSSLYIFGEIIGPDCIPRSSPITISWT